MNLHREKADAGVLLRAFSAMQALRVLSDLPRMSNDDFKVLTGHSFDDAKEAERQGKTLPIAPDKVFRIQQAFQGVPQGLAAAEASSDVINQAVELDHIIRRGFAGSAPKSAKPYKAKPIAVAVPKDRGNVFDIKTGHRLKPT